MSFYATHIESWHFLKRVSRTEEYKLIQDYRLLTEEWEKGIRRCEDLPFGKHHWLNENDGIRSDEIWKKIKEQQSAPFPNTNNLRNIIRQIELNSLYKIEFAATMKAIESQRRYTLLRDLLTTGGTLMAFILAIFAVFATVR